LSHELSGVEPAQFYSPAHMRANPERQCID